MSEPLPDDKQMSLLAIKARACDEFAHIPGIAGVGVGDNRLRIYVRNAEVGRHIPAPYHGVPVDIIVVGQVVLA